MVVSEAADFMDAELETGKTYYALVTPRLGVWKARFSLRPMTAVELDGQQLREWLDACERIENSEQNARMGEEEFPRYSERESRILAEVGTA